ncbi:MAG TPA: hypothetical protein VHI93_08090, partial [Candidatus Thermoplasmatota archaeon]|nr:hypothetical protein [Candidatus Thermoplasmatota archaeon]
PHRSIFPMLEDDGSFNGRVVFEQRHVNATVTFSYWGRGTYRIASDTITADDLEFLRTRLIPEQMGWGRFGQSSSWCSGFVLKAPAPCMNPWEHPLV